MTDETIEKKKIVRLETLDDILQKAIGPDYEIAPFPPDNFVRWEYLPQQVRELCIKEFHDIGNAELLIARYGENLIYIPKSGWFAWTGKVWSQEDGERMLQLYAQETVKDMKEEIFARAAKNYRDNKSKKELNEGYRDYFK